MTSKFERFMRDYDLLADDPFWRGQCTTAATVNSSSWGPNTLEKILASMRAFEIVCPRSTMPVRVDSSPEIYAAVVAFCNPNRELWETHPPALGQGLPCWIRRDLTPRAYSIWYADGHFELHGADVIIPEPFDDVPEWPGFLNLHLWGVN